MRICTSNFIGSHTANVVNACGALVRARVRLSNMEMRLTVRMN